MPAYQYVLVLPIMPTTTPYTYKVDQGQKIELGSYVKVDIRGKKVAGVVWDFTLSDLPDHKIKAIDYVYDLLPISDFQRHFLTWVAKYTTFPLGSVLKLCLGSGELLKPIPQKHGYCPGLKLDKLTGKQQQVIKAFGSFSKLSIANIKRLSGVSDTTIRTMIQAGQLESRLLDTAYPSYKYKDIELSNDQHNAVQLIHESIHQQTYQAYLLDGVTGSGKTEVYFACIAEVLVSCKQALILLPEISLTSQTIQRFKRCFGDKPYVWHSGMTQTQRHKTWQGIVQGDAKVIIGARSALFLPYKNLGLIVVDEEHDSSYKQEDGVMYHARDMAVVKAHIEKIPIVLASATPSLESYVNAKSGKYQHLILQSRHGVAVMPDNHLVDMRATKQKTQQRWISPQLAAAIKEKVKNGQQCLLFLNRRGYAPLTLCRGCGERMHCPDCSTWLVAHKTHSVLTCHHCGFKRQHPKTCPECHEEESFIPCGPGVERIAEEVTELFPDIRVLIIDRDNIQSPKDLDDLLAKVHNHEVDILVGTQMIAKGHHFPNLTLVGVIDADLGLEGGDLRACEKTYQLLHQVSGRAGRETEKGDVYLQTFNPDHPVVQAIINNDRDAFYTLEAHNRELMNLPPYGRLASLIISGPVESMVEVTAKQLARHFPAYENVFLLGPTPAILNKIRANYRWRLLIKAPRQTDLQAIINDWLPRIKRDRKTRIQVDIDPYSFL